VDSIFSRTIRVLGLLRPATLAQPRRVLFVYRFCGLGGVETATLAKVAALRGFGIEASVLFSEFYGDGARPLAAQPGVTVGLDEAAVAELLRTGFDAISVIDYPDFMALLGRQAIETPILFETHCAVPSALDRFYRYLGDPRVRAIVVPSHHNRRLIRERVNPACAIVVVPNAVDGRVFRPGKVKQQALSLNMLDGEKLVLFVGRLEDGKNPGEFIRIAEKVLEQKAGIRFLLVGDFPGSYETQKQQLVDAITASARHAFSFIRTVAHDKMPDLYRLAARTGGVLVSTSRHESLPMIFLEAMACGCPVLSTDVGGVRDVVVDGTTGRLYTPGDVDRAAVILGELLGSGNRKGIERMTRRARRQIVKHHSLRVVATRYRDLLDGLNGRGT
jgi:glycosyltransferase involved in cell wall biosynthesis